MMIEDENREKCFIHKDLNAEKKCDICNRYICNSCIHELRVRNAKGITSYQKKLKILCPYCYPKESRKENMFNLFIFIFFLILLTLILIFTL